MLRILQLRNWRRQVTGDQVDIPLTDLVGELGAVGFRASIVTESANALGRHGLIVSLSHTEPPWDQHARIRIGSAGVYYLEKMIFIREYIENIVDDTMLYREEVLDELVELHGDTSRSWPRRIEDKVRVLLAHLSREEKRELGKLGPEALRPQWIAPVIGRVGVRLFGKAFGRV